MSITKLFTDYGEGEVLANLKESAKMLMASDSEVHPVGFVFEFAGYTFQIIRKATREEWLAAHPANLAFKDVPLGDYFEVMTD